MGELDYLSILHTVLPTEFAFVLWFPLLFVHVLKAMAKPVCMKQNAYAATFQNLYKWR